MRLNATLKSNNKGGDLHLLQDEEDMRRHNPTLSNSNSDQKYNKSQGDFLVMKLFAIYLDFFFFSVDNMVCLGKGPRRQALRDI